jgi:hypothetical protein
MPAEASEMLSKAMCSLVMLAAALLPPSARGSEMFFSTDDVGQIWLQIVGAIDDDDDVKFRNMLLEAIDRGEQIAKVSIYSPGGRVGPAMKIGRYIRNMHLSTVAPQLVPLLGRRTCDIHTTGGRTIVLDYEPLRHRGDPRCVCAGECFLVWAAGFVRYGDAVQIHGLTIDPEDDAKRSDARSSDVQSSSDEIVAEYLREMGIPEATVGRIFNVAAGKTEYLTKDERETLVGRTEWLRELLGTRCRHHAATSPAALACERTVLRELYWDGAKRLLSEHD